MVRIPDYEDRLQAITGVDRNTLVIAGAGTGKTALLASRLCYALGMILTYPGIEAEARLERAVRGIVAMTFTDKAATEMRERVREVVRFWMNPHHGKDRPDAELLLTARQHLLERRRISASFFERLLGQVYPRLSEIRISTIHSFCLGILQAHPLETGLSPYLRVDENNEVFETVFQQGWYRYLKVLATGGSPSWRRRRRSVRKLISGYGIDLSAFETAAKVLARGALVFGINRLKSEMVWEQRLDQAYLDRLVRSGFWSDFLDAIRDAGERATKPEVEEAYRKLLDILEAPDGDISSIRRSLSSAMRASHRFLDNVSTLFSKSAVKRCIERYQDILPEMQVPTFHSIFKAWLYQIDYRLVRYLLDASWPIIVRTVRRYRREGVVTFDEMLYRTLHLLNRRPEIRRRLVEDIHHLLVDEFQDTNRVQIDILRYLATDPEKQKWIPGRLFVVGDPKQSIYAFRDADLAAYQAFFIELSRQPDTRLIVLKSNFRSRPGLVASVNAIAGPLFNESRQPYEDTGDASRFCLEIGDKQRQIVLPADLMQPPYEAITAVRPEEKPFKPHFVCFSPIRERDDACEAIARFVARQVIEYAIEYGTDTSPDWSRVALLFRTLKTSPLLASLTRVFHEYGIPFVLERSRTFFEKPEVVDFINLLTLLIYPTDVTALFGVLRSPVFGFSDSLLIRLFFLNNPQDGEQSEPFPLFVRMLASVEDWNRWGRKLIREGLNDEVACRRVEQWIDWFHALRKGVENLTPSRMVLETLRRSPFLSYYRRRPDGEQRIMNLWKIYELATTQSAVNRLDAFDFVQRLREQAIESVDEPESLISDPELNACTWMTIHNAKGLEFDVVFLMDTEFLLEKPGRRGRSPEDSVQIKIDAYGKLEVEAHGGPNIGRIHNVTAVVNRFIHDQVEEAEKIRTFYVAITRAREALWLICRCKPGKENQGCRVWNTLDESAKRYMHFEYAPDVSTVKIHGVHSEKPPEIFIPGNLEEPWQKIISLWEEFPRAPEWIRYPSEADRFEEREEIDEASQAPEMSWVTLISLDEGRLKGRIVGTLAHYLLETLPLSDASSPEDDLAWVRRELERMKADEILRPFVVTMTDERIRELWETCVKEVESMMSAFLCSPVWMTIRSGIKFREWPFILVHDREERDPLLWEGRIDVVYEDERGHLVAGDYKTDRDVRDDEIIRKYRSQLEIYREAVAKTHPGKTVEAEIILVREARRIRLPHG